MPINRLITLPLCLFSFINLLFTQPFEVDATFGNNGEIMLFEITDSSRFIGGMTLQKDDKIILKGNEKPQIFRTNQDGFLDNTFGENGRVLKNISNDIIFSKIVTQPDEHIIILGKILNEGIGIDETMLIRINGVGELDKNFGKNGMLLIKELIQESVVRNLLVQSDGKIVMSMVRRISELDVPTPISERILIRINLDGSLDKEFGVEGITVLDINTNSPILTQQKDGKILTAYLSENRNRNTDFQMVRYDETGNIDSTFGKEGTLVINFNLGTIFPNSLDVLNNGQILFVGTAKNRIKDDIALVRITNNGYLDTTFGDKGIVLTNLKGGDNVVFQSNDRIYDVLHKPDGRILVRQREKNN